MDLKYVTGPITKASAGGLEAVITTPRVDSDGESVDPLGITNKAEWLTNPLIYWAHEWAFDMGAEPIGKGTSLEVSKADIKSAAEYAPTPKAQNVRALVQGGFVRKTSIGFDPLEMSDIKGVPTHTRWALREWSIVPMPANTDATITGTKAALRWFAEQIAEPEAEVSASAWAVTMTPEAIDRLVRDDESAFGVAESRAWSRDFPDQASVVERTIALSERRVVAGIRRRRMLTLP